MVEVGFPWFDARCVVIDGVSVCGHDVGRSGLRTMSSTSRSLTTLLLFLITIAITRATITITTINR